MSLNITKDIRLDLHNVRHQGRRPTCLSFAASDVHRHARRHPEYLCVEWLYYHVSQYAGTGPHDGTTIDDTRSVLRALGQPEEPVWPYTSQPPDPGRWQPPSIKCSLMVCDSSGCSASLQGIRESVDQDQPVVIGLYTSDTFNFPYTWDHDGDEVILGTDLEQPVDYKRGHAMVAVGHGNYEEEPVVLLRNSWGRNWGHNGHAWVRESYLSPRLAGAFVISKGDDDVLQSDGRNIDAYTSARLG